MIINSLDINSKIISKSTLSHIPLPLFLVPPDHQDQHFNNYFKVTENTTLDYNNPDTYTIDLEKLKLPFIDENILYSPIPKLKIKEKEVDMSLAGIFINHNGNQKGKEFFYKEKQNEDDIKIYSTANTF